MWNTRDGYRIRLPRFRGRRMLRRYGQRGIASPRWLPRALGLVLTRAARVFSDAAPSSHPVFRSRLGSMPLVIYTRRVAPRRLELLYVARRGR